MLYDMIWHDIIWYDMIYDVRYLMTWYDVAWYDMIWYDIWYDIFTPSHKSILGEISGYRTCHIKSVNNN